MTSPNDPQDLTQAFTNPGASAVPNPEEVNNFHRYDDVDNFPESHHHTLGIDPNQASPGGHKHDGRDSEVLQGYALTTHDHGESGGTVTGSITMFAASIPPDGWLLCNGQALQRTDYPELFAVIGTTYGTSNAANFFVPNLSSRFPVGASPLYPLATTGGSKDHGHFSGSVSHGHTVSASDSGHAHSTVSHTHSEANHSHSIANHSHSVADHNHSVAVGSHAHTGTGGNHAHFVPAGTQGTASSQAAGSVTVASHNIGTLGTTLTGATASSNGPGSTSTTTPAGTGSASPNTNSAAAAISASSGNASTNVYANEIDLSLPPFLSLAFIIKA